MKTPSRHCRTPFSPPLLQVSDDLREKAGDVLGQYRLIALIGEGSMGRVFKARHLHLPQVVAVKVLRLEYAHNRDVLRRFFQEAQAVNRIAHENIVQVLDVIDERGRGGLPRVYCVMELVEGMSVTERLSRGPLSIREAADIARQVCGALAAAHRVGVVHRDLKPDNLLLRRTPDGSTRVKVLDFGVAKLLEPLAGPGLTQTAQGLMLGTPGYMAPEQALGRDTDGRADIYGLGVVLYELLTGALPFAADSLADLLVQVVRTPPRAMRSQTAAGEAIPEGLRRLVLQCLEKDRSRRPATMEKLAESLDRYCVPELSAARPRRSLSVRLAVPSAIAAALLAVVAAARDPRMAPPPQPLPLPEVVRERAPATAALERTFELRGPAPSAPIKTARATRRPARPARKFSQRQPGSVDGVIDPFED